MLPPGGATTGPRTNSQIAVGTMSTGAKGPGCFIIIIWEKI
jgi:hypothetical protein